MPVFVRRQERCLAYRDARGRGLPRERRRFESQNGGRLGLIGARRISVPRIRITGRRSSRLIAVFCAVVFIATLWLYRRPVGETLGEWLLRLMYRMRVVGPGVDQLPRTGPVLVIANHTAFLDPCWIMIPLPRDLTPIMYGDYFKKFGLHFYMKHIINAIPSGLGKVRREAPELAEAVHRLDCGEGILIFPEGWVRRKEEDTIRRFARGRGGFSAIGRRRPWSHVGSKVAGEAGRRSGTGRRSRVSASTFAGRSTSACRCP